MHGTLTWAKPSSSIISLGVPELQDLCPDVINLKNGLFDLSTGELLPHTPDHLSSVQIQIEYDPTATCPKIDKFIKQVFPADAIKLAWEILGDALTSDRSIQKAILLIGEGGNGKGVFLALYNNFVGRANISTLSLHQLEGDRFALARLYGKLANVCGDLPSEHLVGTSVLKGITGGDLVSGQYKFRDSFEFKPHARLVFSANHLPQSKDASKAFFDRWVVVPFDNTFRGTGKEIPRSILDARLSAPRELSGALNKALPTLRRLRKRGRFSDPESTRDALQEFRDIADPLAVWLDRETVMGPDNFVTKEELFRRYNTDCERHGRPPMTSQAFGRALSRLREVDEAQRTIQGKRQWVYMGIGLCAPDARDALDLSNLIYPTNRGDLEEGEEEVINTREEIREIRVKCVQPVPEEEAA